MKALRRGIASKSALRRFEHESQTLARLRHPCIAQVYEAGTFDDPDAPGERVPYFAMEYIPGARPITRYADDRNLGTRQRLELFAQVCDAVHHGHQKGIIHRDLKPANLLVNSAGQVKIIDFGVARSTDSDMAVTTVQTDMGQLIGTLQYMSPEQCRGDPHDIDTRSDVYALGVVLYELLCGRPPYDVAHKGLHEVACTVCEQRPIRPSAINRALRGDVETIVLKALEKDRERRYRSVAELEEDIKRYLRNDPIIARPPSIAYQFRVFARRNRALFGAVAAVFTMLVAGIIVSASLYVRAERAQTETEAVTDFVINDLLTSASPANEPNRELTVREVLDRASRGVKRQFQGQPLVKAKIQEILGNTYRTLGEYKEAEEHLRRSLELRRSELGDAHPDTLTSMDKLGAVYTRRGRHDEAGELWTQTLELRRRELGEQHPDTLESMNNLAVFYYRKGRYREAEDLGLRTLKLRRRTLGEEHEDTLITMSNLARLYASQGQYEKSERLWSQTLEARLRTLGEEHPDTLYSMHHLATLYGEQGRYDQAEELWRRTIELHRRHLPEDHPDTLESIGNFGATLLGKGELARAEPMLRTAVDKLPAALPDDHEKVGIARSNLGACLSKMGRHVEAEQQLLQALRVLKSALGADHRQTVKTVERLASLYDAWDKPDKAAEYRAMSPASAEDVTGRRP